MVGSEAIPPTETVQVDEEKQLKYLDFVQVAVVYVVVWFSSVYEHAKENAGPLKPGVQAVEGTVKTVIGPVYEKFHDVPFELLKFIDHKVDELLKETDRHMPSVMKQASSRAMSAAQMAPKLARTIGSEIQQTGFVNTGTHLAKTVYTTYEPTAKQLYSKYEPLAEHYAVSACWQSLNKIPLFPQMAGIMVPTGVYWAEKYNQTVRYTADKGFAIAPYLPMVPIAKIGKIFEGDRGNDVATNGEYVAVAQ